MTFIILSEFIKLKNVCIKGIFESATSYAEDRDVSTMPAKKQVTERICKLISINASVIYQIP